ncbi:MAG: glycosyltransferase family 39 protein [Burkholderiales bacterium]|nr:glycosyltransferase family 39 protein [Burkholderiales bacterium]
MTASPYFPAKKSTFQLSATQAFACFAAIHLLLFTLLPVLLTSNLPLDAIEALVWGHEWQLGYYKHPPMSAWLAELFRFGTHDWTIYALSQVMVIAAFSGAWLLAADLMNPWLATLSVMALEGVHYHNISSLEFNANVVMYPFWPWACLAFWRALKTGHLRWWALLGLVCGLGTLGKYVFLALPAAMTLYLLAHPDGRAHWRGKGPWLAMGVFALVMSPHAFWLIQHHAPTLNYALNRGHASDVHATFGHWLGQLVDFLGAQAFTLMPMWVLLRILGWPGPQSRRPSADTWAMLAMGAGPLFLFVLAAIVLRIDLLHMWASTLFLTSAPLLLAWRPPAELQVARFVRAVILWTAFSVGIYALYIVLGPKLKHHPDRTDFPGRELATMVETRWHQLTKQPLKVVVGDSWVAGNVAAYSSDHPSVYVEGNPAEALWLNDSIVKERGAVFVWLADRSTPPLVSAMRERFPSLQQLPDATLHSLVNGHQFPVSVAWAVLLPQAQPETPPSSP